MNPFNHIPKKKVDLGNDEIGCVFHFRNSYGVIVVQSSTNPDEYTGVAIKYYNTDDWKVAKPRKIVAYKMDVPLSEMNDYLDKIAELEDNNE